MLVVARDEHEAEWTAAAMHLPVAELQRRVKETGHDPCADTFEVESIVFRMTEAEQDRLDAALDLAKVVVGPATPRWQRLEAICQEWFGEFGGFEARIILDLPPCARGVEQPRLERTLGPVEEERVELPDDAVGLDARARDLLRERHGREESLGRVLEGIARDKLWRELGYRSFEEYCVERLGMSARRVRERTWLERRMCALPELREALADS